MSNKTGKHISGNEARRQAVFDVLMTPLNSVVMHRSYGSMLPNLLAKPQNEHTLQLLKAATATALLINIPQFKQRKVSFSDVTADGKRTLQIKGRWGSTNQTIQGAL